MQVIGSDMLLEDQVCSLELSKRLKELGVKQESLFYWVRPIDIWQLTAKLTEQDGIYFNHTTIDIFPMDNYSAFTVAELGEMLPEWHDSCKRQENDWHVRVFEKKKNNICHNAFDESEANARAKMLVFLLDQGLIKND